MSPRTPPATAPPPEGSRQNTRRHHPQQCRLWQARKRTRQVRGRPAPVAYDHDHDLDRGLYRPRGQPHGEPVPQLVAGVPVGPASASRAVARRPTAGLSSVDHSFAATLSLAWQRQEGRSPGRGFLAVGRACVSLAVGKDRLELRQPHSNTAAPQAEVAVWWTTALLKEPRCLHTGWLRHPNRHTASPSVTSKESDLN